MDTKSQRLDGKVANVTGASSQGEGRSNGKAASFSPAREGAKVFLASDEVKWITGASLPVDGGLMIVKDRTG